MILAPLQKLTNNAGNLFKIIVATGFELLPKVQKIAQSGHTTSFSNLVCSTLVRCTKHEAYLNASNAAAYCINYLAALVIWVQSPDQSKTVSRYQSTFELVHKRS